MLIVVAVKERYGCGSIVTVLKQVEGLNSLGSWFYKQNSLHI